MSNVRIESVEAPLAEPEIALAAARVLARADAMGLLGRRPVSVLDKRALRGVMRELVAEGVARDALIRFETATDDPAGLARALGHLLDALQDSPLPRREVGRMMEVLGHELLARLLDIGQSSLRRYAAGERAMPDEVAERLHVVTLVVADLAGAYNDIGVRRWFERSRTQLGGKAPIDVLRRGWSADDEGPRRVRELAESLTGSPAT